MEHRVPCPHCGGPVVMYRNPAPTVDILIHEPGRGIVLIRRRNEPPGWALPGGFIDYGESAEAAALREAREETGLNVELTGLVGVYSEPGRDPRHHTLSVVYAARVRGGAAAIPAAGPVAGDDAADARFFAPDDLPHPMAFDHATIIADWLRGRAVCPERVGEGN
ncbi:NUDIX hydrolase [Nitratidesulfovibrio sp. HK-II]|uniref:NUDIX domain-containing protein n=1 Tax=Nitratidesulfovibrio sp. HK-II TaxID=2009266 RepID=UPI000EE20758|nr:NUDIX hydrolase [Nitratidesulfovibrio sp. HK-II]GBO95528.1 ADP-ribose pyrophosphatase [Nitratidesulfovibrio sp. HK-II]